MRPDFILSVYRDLCQAVQTMNKPVVSLKDYLEKQDADQMSIMFRHDVDRNIKRAVRIAQIEAEYGIYSTYYIRMVPGVFQHDYIRQLARLGHDVGYHYETLSKTYGDRDKAISLFIDELKKFREIVPVHTVSMHGSPHLPWNNLSIIPLIDLESLGLKGDVSLNIDYSSLYYFTDTGRNWDTGKHNLRDKVSSLKIPVIISHTFQLIEFLQTQCLNPVLINTHPNRWTKKGLEYYFSCGSDIIINAAKLLIARSYNSQRIKK